MSARLAFCGKCGLQLAADAAVCSRCGAVRGERPGNDAAMRWILPVGRSPWAIAAGYLGLFALLVIPAPFALATGIMAVRDIRANPATHGMGRAIFGIVMGAIFSLILVALLVAFFAPAAKPL
jgi:hypothetical protein